MDCVCVWQSVKQTPSSYGNPRGPRRRRSSFNLPSPDYLAAAAPSSVKWQTKLQQQRVPLATAQLLRPAAKARKLRVCLGFSEHPAAPSLLQLLIKQVSYLSHHHSTPFHLPTLSWPWSAAWCKPAAEMSMLSLNLPSRCLFFPGLPPLCFMTFRTPTLGHAHH